MSACKSILVQLTGVSFIDDTSLGVTQVHPDDDICVQLSALVQHWERLLFSTCGAINFQKSLWYRMTWVWQHGLSKLCTIAHSPAVLHLTTGYSTTATKVPWLEVSNTFRALGVYLYHTAYLRPKLIYLLPCSTLTQNQCRHI
jgi:hypothetical protein